MRIINWALLAAVILLLIPAAIVDAAGVRTHPGSFITSTVDSPEEMATLIELNGKVGRRFANHFGMSTDELASYFRDHVSVARLDQARTYTMYFIGRNGRVASRQVRLGKGERVFVAENGKALMALRCGNPISKNLPEIPEEIPEPLPNGMSTTEIIPELVPAVIETEPIETLEISVAEPLEPEFILVAENPGIELLPAITKNVGWVLPVIAGAGVLISDDDTPVVPEPSSLMVLGMGGLPALLMLRRRIRR